MKELEFILLPKKKLFRAIKVSMTFQFRTILATAKPNRKWSAANRKQPQPTASPVRKLTAAFRKLEAATKVRPLVPKLTKSKKNEEQQTFGIVSKFL